MNKYYRNRLGFVLLAIFLVLYGLEAFGLKFSGMGTILAVLAIAAGILIFINR